MFIQMIQVLYFKRQLSSQCLDFVDFRQHCLQLIQCFQFFFNAQFAGIFFCFFSHSYYKYLMGFVLTLVMLTLSDGNISRMIE